MANRNDLEQIKIIFKAINLFIPAHRPFQRMHRMVGQVKIALFNIDMKINVAPGHGLKTINSAIKITNDRRE